MTQLSSEKPELFKGRHFNHLLIIQAVRWYVTYKLSYRDVCDLMAERGVTVVHTTVLRWVQRFVPAFEKKWKNYARPVGSSWRVDEAYIKVKGPFHPFSQDLPRSACASATESIGTLWRQPSGRGSSRNPGSYDNELEYSGLCMKRAYHHSLFQKSWRDSC